MLAIAVLVAVATGVRAQSTWRDIDGEPLPFDETELIDFLAHAEVVDERPIGTGINQSVRLTLSRDGVTAHAIFREAEVRKRGATIEGVTYPFFADSYKFECAAYALARLLDIPNVPPVTLRRVGRRDGSAQIWLEDALDEDSDGFKPPRPRQWVQQIWDMVLFDNLIYNIDRNSGNVLVDTDYRLWMIDHTRAFQFKHELLDDRVARVRRSSWENLLKLDEDTLRDAVRGYLTPMEIGSIRERRERLIALIEGLVAARGESAVFY